MATLEASQNVYIQNTHKNSKLNTNSFPIDSSMICNN